MRPWFGDGSGSITDNLRKRCGVLRSHARGMALMFAVMRGAGRTDGHVLS